MAQTEPPSQAAQVTTPPPPIAFEAWRKTGEEEFLDRYEVSFPSAGTSPYAENQTVKLTAALPKVRSGPLPVVILLHFWGATDSQIENSLAVRLADQGIASIILPLPYHLSRTPKGFRSGQLAIQPEPERLVETMIQSVVDVRRAVDWIETRPEFNKDQVGLSGTSLGSIVSALVVAVEPRIKASCFSLGGVDLARILWNSSTVVLQREQLRRRGLTEEKMRELLAPVEPLNYLKPGAGGQSLVVVARHDTVIPAASSSELIKALETPNVITLETGHYGGVFVQNKLLRAIAGFFGAALRGRPYKVPSSFYAPTIRVGLQYTGNQGLQVAAGLDVWRSDANGTGFASALMTPKGPQGYLGFRLTREFSLGAGFSKKGTTWGLFWSIVL